MIRSDINKLIKDYGVKKEAIIAVLDSNRPTFSKKMKDNSFEQIDKVRLYSKYRGIL